MTHPGFTFWLKCWFAAFHINHISLPLFLRHSLPFSLSLSLMQLCCFNMKTQREHPLLLADCSTASAGPESARMSSSPPSCCMFFFSFFFLHYSARLHVTWPHKRNWQRRELSLSINWMSQGLSARTVTAVSCITFSNTFCVGSRSGVILVLSQQVGGGRAWWSDHH